MNIERFLVKPGERHPLRGRRPDETGQFKDKDAAVEPLERGLKRLQERQELLYAQDRYALLLIFQGLDAAGKDSAIRHVMAGVSPQGTEVHAFKEPSAEELAHDYLWRVNRVLPARGRIGVFNRSHYEDVLVVRVHPPILDAERLPPETLTSRIWRRRFEDINAFERHLSRNGTVIRKFFLHVSRKKQAQRLLERLDDPGKHWKFKPNDLAERKKRSAYLAAYDETLAATSTDDAPWYVVPADHKWFTHLVIAEVIVKTLEDLDLDYPQPSATQRRLLNAARRLLENE